MYARILVCTDGSALAEHAAAHAVRLAAATGAELIAVHASPAFTAPIGFEFVPASLLPLEAYEESTRRSAARYLGVVSAMAEKAGVACRTRHLRSLPPADAIVAIAQRSRAQLIVMGSHGRGQAAQLWLGSVTARVLADCSIPVLVHRDPKAARKRRD